MSKFRDQLKETAKNIILTDNLLAPVTRYRLAVCSAVNDDGTVLTTVDGNEVTAFPLYPIVLGQNIMLIFGDIAGKVSAVPLRPAVPAPDLIHPPYFTGGKSRTATIHQLGGSLPLPPTANTSVDFQDQGDTRVYRLSFPDLPSQWTLASSIGPQSTGFAAAPYAGVTLSADGSYACVVLWDGTQFESTSVIGNYKLRLYNIGAKMQSTTVLDSDNNVYQMEATLVEEYDGIYNNIVSLPSSIGGQFVNYLEMNFPVDTFISTGNKMYWLEAYTMVFVSNGSVSMGTPLNLFQAPPGGILAESLCTVYYVKRLDPGGFGTIISVILATYQPGPTAFQNYQQFSPVGILDIRDDETVIRVYGALSLSLGLPYSTLAAAVMDLLPKPAWTTSSGGWLTLNQTPATKYQSAYTVAYTSPMQISYRVMNTKYSCFNFEDSVAVPVFARLVPEIRSNAEAAVSNYGFSEIAYPLGATISPVLVKNLQVDDNGVGAGGGGGVQFVEKYSSPQWLGNMFTDTFVLGVVNKSNTPQAFTPKYTNPDSNNIASVGFAKNAGLSPTVVWVSF
jgi:hypothetical protein